MVLLGNTAEFAIESHIEVAYERPSALALGYFVLHLRNCQFGVKAADATLLACSRDEVITRLKHRGQHVAPELSSVNANSIAQAYLNARFAGLEGELETAIRTTENADILVWAPDGDEAFDDGSNVLQFDVSDQVRIIGFRNINYEAKDIREVWMNAEAFYTLLADWTAAFDKEWQERPKVPG